MTLDTVWARAAENSSASLRASSVAGAGIEQDLAHLLPEVGAARLARDQHVGALGAQVLLGQFDLGALARAFDALEGDEHPGGGRPLQLRHERERLGPGETVALEQTPGVEARRHAERAGGPQRQPVPDRSKRCPPM